MPEARRTYFQVGDVKQSIYRWRGGEPELAEHVRDRYTPDLADTRCLMAFGSAGHRDGERGIWSRGRVAAGASGRHGGALVRPMANAHHRSSPA